MESPPTMNLLRGVHFGAYWMGENDVVRLMARDLEPLCALRVVDTGLYAELRSGWTEEDRSRAPRWPIHWLDHDRALAVIREHRARFVVVNAGGMAFRPETVEVLRREGIVTVGIALSDPDVYPDQGAVFAREFDLFYTNSKHSLLHQYPKELSVRLLPFAASPRLHRPMPEVRKRYDVVVVGHARPDRVEAVKRLRRVCSVGTYGRGWGRFFQPGPVNGEAHVRAINSGSIYLSFAATMAGFTNVKVGIFEAAACRTCIVTQRFDEMAELFRYGDEIEGYGDLDELERVVGRLVGDPGERERLAEASYRRLLKDHTWTVRWKGVLDDVRARGLG